MKKNSIVAVLFLITLFTACGPAAEDREKMHARAKVFQDSIATFIRTSMAEAEAPATAPVHVHQAGQVCPTCGRVVEPPATPTNTMAAATATPK